MGEEQYGVRDPSRERSISADEESWVRSRILTAVRMSLAVQRECAVAADSESMQSGIEGIVNGCAIEVIRTLGLDAPCVNLRRTCINDIPYGNLRPK